MMLRRHSILVLLSLFCFSSLLLGAFSSPLSEWFYKLTEGSSLLTTRPLQLSSPVSRQFTFSSIDGTYTSVFKFAAVCPNTITFSDTTVDGSVSTTPFSGISINGNSCQGNGSMKSVREPVARNPDRPQQLGLNDFTAFLEENVAATAVLDGGVEETEVLVGFDGVQRNCGAGGSYPEDTFYFFIREEGGFNITVGTQGSNRTTTIPGDRKGIFIVENVAEVQGRRPRLCILTAPADSDAQAGVSPEAEAESSPEPTGDASATDGPAVPGGVAVPGDGSGEDGNIGPTASPEADDSDVSDTGVTGATGIGGEETSGPAADDTDASPTDDEDDDSDSDVGGVDFGDGDLDGSPEGSPEDDGSVCFPGSASVELENGRRIQMRDLEIGDRVKTAKHSYSEVFMFTHRYSNIQHSFLRIKTEAGPSVMLTSQHYIYIKREGKSRMVQAKEVSIGDMVTLGSTGEDVEVTAKETVAAAGLFNPQTLEGSIVVDGIRTSTYTAAVHPSFAHNVLLAPVRWAYSAGLVQEPFGNFFNRGSEFLAGLAPSGPKELL